MISRTRVLSSTAALRAQRTWKAARALLAIIDDVRHCAPMTDGETPDGSGTPKTVVHTVIQVGPSEDGRTCGLLPNAPGGNVAGAVRQPVGRPSVHVATEQGLYGRTVGQAPIEPATEGL
jgi:hypothetical protein